MKRSGTLIFLFVLGLLLGMAAGRWSRFYFPRQGHSPEKKAEQMLNLLTRRLDLTDDQRAKIKTIVENKRQAIEQVHKETHPRLKQAWDTAHAEIRQVLNDEQKKKFDVLEKKMEKRRERRRGKFGHGRGMW